MVESYKLRKFKRNFDVKDVTYESTTVALRREIDVNSLQ